MKQYAEHRKRGAAFVALGTGFTSVALIVACSDDGGGSSSSNAEAPSAVELSSVLRKELVIEYKGVFDGSGISLVPQRVLIDGQEQHSPVMDVGGGIGTHQQAILDTVDSGAFPSGVSGTGTDLVALEQIAGSLATRTNGVATGAAWDVATCGPIVRTGVCVKIRARNLFTNVMLQRVHFELTALTPVGATTSVTVRTPSSTVQTAPADSFYGVAGAQYGLWRYGALDRSSDPGAGPILSWAFVGSTPVGSQFTFTFEGRVRADIVPPPVRADVADGTSDLPPAYGSGIVGNQNAQGEVDIDETGRYVVFTSRATNLIAGTTAAIPRVYRQDFVNNDVTLISTGPSLAVPEGCASQHPSVSADGSVIAFESDCALVPGDTNGLRDVYVRRLGDATTILASGRGINGLSADGASDDAAISADGAWVVFASTATNIFPNRPVGRTFTDIYRRDVRVGATPNLVIPVSWYRAPGIFWLDGNSRAPKVAVIPGTPATITVFETDAPDASASPDSNGVTDVVAYYHAFGQNYTGSRTRISESSTGDELDAPSTTPAISRDGSYIVFASAASNVLPTPTTTSHIYGRPRFGASSIALLDRTPTGGIGNGNSTNPDISYNSRFVSFTSTSTNLLLNPVSGLRAYFVDRLALEPAFRRAFLVSSNEDFVPAGTLSGAPALSGNGSFVAFLAAGGGIIPGTVGTHVYRSPTVDRRNQ